MDGNRNAQMDQDIDRQTDGESTKPTEWRINRHIKEWMSEARKRKRREMQKEMGKDWLNETDAEMKTGTQNNRQRKADQCRRTKRKIHRQKGQETK